MKIDPAKLEIAKEILSNYNEDDKLKWFNIIHLYPNYKTKLKDNNCFRDCLQFKAVVYNTELDKYRELGNYHDRLEFTDFYLNSQLPVKHLNIFADGSVLIKFSKFVQLPGTFYLQVIELTTKDV